MAEHERPDWVQQVIEGLKDTAQANAERARIDRETAAHLALVTAALQDVKGMEMRVRECVVDESAKVQNCIGAMEAKIVNRLIWLVALAMVGAFALVGVKMVLPSAVAATPPAVHSTASP